MQSFKQYLFEQVGPVGKVEFVVDVACANQISSRAFNAFEARIKKRLSKYDIIIEPDDNIVIVHVLNLNAQNGNQIALENVLEQIEETATDVIPNYSNRVESYDPYLSCKGFPPFKLEWRDIYINCQDQQRITGIDKFIDLNENCIFYDCEKIVGGVLSLLKIKYGSLYVDGQPTAKWVPIIKKHLADKNIIACQEELFHNNLDEFAKL